MDNLVINISTFLIRAHKKQAQAGSTLEELGSFDP